MIDNLYLGPEAGVNHSLALLRGLTTEKAVRPRVDLVPGIFLSIDPDAVVRGTVSSTPGEMLTLRLSPAGPTRWMSLHLQMGSADLRAVEMLGIVLRSRAPQSLTFRVALRSGVDGGYSDTLFRKTVVAYAEASVHMDVIDLSREPAVPRDAVWREIILMFDQATIDLNLQNLGVFAV